MTFKDQDQVVADAVNIIDSERVESSVANRPHDQAFENTDFLASIINANRNLVIRGGGNLLWTHATRRLSVPEKLYLEYPNEEVGSGSGGTNQCIINSGLLIFPSDASRFAFLKVPRSGNSTFSITDGTRVVKFDSMLAAKTAMESEADSVTRFEYVFLCARDIGSTGSLTQHLILWDGTRLRDTYTRSNEGSSDSQYAQSSVITTLQTTDRQNLNLIMSGGGLISWAGDGNGLVLDEELEITFPEDVYAEISAGTLPAIGLDQVYQVTLNRTTGFSGILTPTVVDRDMVTTASDNTFILGYASSLDGRLYLANGTVVGPGSSILLGGVPSGVKWKFTGVGDGLTGFDFTTASGTIQPTGAIPAFTVGSGELSVWVNGVLQAEGQWAGAGASADYDEVGTIGTVSTEITWTPPVGPPAGSIPNAGDVIVALVGLANANQGPAGPAGGVNTLSDGSTTVAGDVVLTSPNGTINFTSSTPLTMQVDVTAVGVVNNVDIEDSTATSKTAGAGFEGDVVLQEDAASETITLTPSGGKIIPSVGTVITDVLNGQRIQGGSPGALLAFLQKPSIRYVDSTTIMISPGEIPIADTAAPRNDFRVLRLWVPVTVDVTTDVIDTDPSSYPAAFYVYANIPSGDANHDAEPEIKISKRAPEQSIGSFNDWLAHPSDGERTYIGSIVCDGTGGNPPSSVLAFDRVGDLHHFRHSAASEMLVQLTGGPSGLQTVTLNGLIPITASGVRLQAQILMEVSPGAGITGLNFITGQMSDPATFTTALTGAYPVQLTAQTGVAQMITGSDTFSWAPFTIPINDESASIPAAPTVRFYPGPDIDTVRVVILGYIEDNTRLQRFYS